MLQERAVYAGTRLRFINIGAHKNQMKTDVKESSQKITTAFWTLGDYFSRLGGATRYFNMPESDIPLYIACQLAKRYSPSFSVNDYVSPEFTEAAKPVLSDVNSRLEAVTEQGAELGCLISEFVSYTNSKLKKEDLSPRWRRFIEWTAMGLPNQRLNAIAPKDGAPH